MCCSEWYSAIYQRHCEWKVSLYNPGLCIRAQCQLGMELDQTCEMMYSHTQEIAIHGVTVIWSLKAPVMYCNKHCWRGYLYGFDTVSTRNRKGPLHLHSTDFVCNAPRFWQLQGWDPNTREAVQIQVRYLFTH